MNRLVHVMVVLSGAAVLAAGCSRDSSSTPMPAAQTRVTMAPFARTPDDQAVDLITLNNPNGIQIRVMTYGATILSIKTPDKAGQTDDITLGFDTFAPYVDKSPYFGAVVGRYGNRIAKGKFTLDGQTYTLATNNGENHLHGGTKGFDKARVEGRAVSERVRRRREVDLRQPGRRGGLPGHVDLHGHVHADRRQQARRRLPRDDGQGDRGQPDAAHLLQSGGRQGQRHPRPRADDQCRPLHARGRHADSDRRAGAGRGHAVRLPHADGHRRAHRTGQRTARSAARATTTTGC